MEPKDTDENVTVINSVNTVVNTTAAPVAQPTTRELAERQLIWEMQSAADSAVRIRAAEILLVHGFADAPAPAPKKRGRPKKSKK